MECRERSAPSASLRLFGQGTSLSGKSEGTCWERGGTGPRLSSLDAHPGASLVLFRAASMFVVMAG